MGETEKEIIRLLKEALEFAKSDGWNDVYQACEAVIISIDGMDENES